MAKTKDIAALYSRRYRKATNCASLV
jgi:hypothetical protein